MKQFFKLGAILFGIVGLCNLGTLIYQWNILFILAKISSIASILFNFLLVAFFYKNYKDIPEMPKELMSDEEMINKAIGGNKNAI